MIPPALKSNIDGFVETSGELQKGLNCGPVHRLGDRTERRHKQTPTTSEARNSSGRWMIEFDDLSAVGIIE